MKFFLQISILLFMSLSNNYAYSAGLSAIKLYNYCMIPLVRNTPMADAIKIGYCNGYFKGVLDGEVSMRLESIKQGNKLVLWKFPKDVTVGHLKSAFIQYMERNPRENNIDSSILITFAFKEAFPK